MSNARNIAAAGALLLAAMLMVMPTATAAEDTDAAPPASELYGERASYLVLRGDTPAGAHELTFTGDETLLTVTAQTRATMRVFGLFEVPFQYDSRAVWQNGVLVSLSADVVRGDKEERYQARQDGEEYRAQDGKRAPAPIFPTNHWNIAAMSAGESDDATQPIQRKFFNTLNGRFINVNITPARQETITINGEDITATRYDTGGDLDISVWYDARGKWLQMRFSTFGATYRFVYAGDNDSVSSTQPAQ